MAEHDDDSLIGYDPLAWMHEAGDKGPIDSDDLAIQAGEAIAEPLQQVTVEAGNAETGADNEHESDDRETAGVDICQLTLGSVQNIQNVVQLHEQLIRALDRNHKIEIDASAITQIDTTTLQLLLVLKRTAVNLQREVTIDFPSDRFVEAAKLLGLAEILEVDQAAAGFF